MNNLYPVKSGDILHNDESTRYLVELDLVNNLHPVEMSDTSHSDSGTHSVF